MADGSSAFYPLSHLHKKTEGNNTGRANVRQSFNDSVVRNYKMQNDV